MRFRQAQTDGTTRSGRAFRGPRQVMLMTGAAAAAGLLAAGCGSNTPATHQASGGDTPLRAITLAAQQAGQVTSFTSTVSVRMTGTPSATLAGTVTMRTKPTWYESAHFTSLSADGQTIPGGMQEVATSQTLYVKMAELQQALGKPWASLPYSELQKRTGVNLSQLTQQIQGNDPMLDAQMLAGAKNVTKAGTATIDGVATTEYTGSLPVSAGLAKLPASQRGAEQKRLSAAGIQTLGFTAWVDAQHQIRKITVTEHGSSQTTAATMQITSINRPVTATVPPASQVKAIPASLLQG